MIKNKSRKITIFVTSMAAAISVLFIDAFHIIGKNSLSIYQKILAYNTNQLFSHARKGYTIFHWIDLNAEEIIKPIPEGWNNRRDDTENDPHGSRYHLKAI